MKKENNPLISILMPNYNNEKYLSEAIESILNQTYKNFEFIIIDDCSTDNSWELIQKYAKKDKRIRAYRNDRNLKIVKTLNKALKLVNGKYIGRMDGDDIVTLDKFEKQVTFLEKNLDVDCVGTNLELTNSNMKKIGVRMYPKTHNEIKKKLSMEASIAHATILIKSDILKKAKYSLGNELAEDYDLWFRLFQRGVIFHNLQEITYFYRQHENQGKFTNLKGTLLKAINVKRRYIFKGNFFSMRSSFHFVLQCILLLLPKRFIFWLFYKLNSRK